MLTLKIIYRNGHEEICEARRIVKSKTSNGNVMAHIFPPDEPDFKLPVLDRKSQSSDDSPGDATEIFVMNESGQTVDAVRGRS